MDHLEQEATLNSTVNRKSLSRRIVKSFLSFLITCYLIEFCLAVYATIESQFLQTGTRIIKPIRQVEYPLLIQTQENIFGDLIHLFHNENESIALLSASPWKEVNRIRDFVYDQAIMSRYGNKTSDFSEIRDILLQSRYSIQTMNIDIKRLDHYITHTLKLHIDHLQNVSEKAFWSFPWARRRRVEESYRFSVTFSQQNLDKLTKSVTKILTELRLQKSRTLRLHGLGLSGAMSDRRRTSEPKFEDSANPEELVLMSAITTQQYDGYDELNKLYVAMSFISNTLENYRNVLDALYFRGFVGISQRASGTRAQINAVSEGRKSLAKVLVKNDVLPYVERAVLKAEKQNPLREKK